MSIKSVLSIAFIFVGLNSIAKTVVIFESSMGSGHEIAAQAIKEDLEAKDPTVKVIRKNIRDFMNPKTEAVDRKTYWWVVKNAPNVLEWAFDRFIHNGQSVVNFSKFAGANNYNVDGIIEWLKQVNPDSIIATHYGSAIALSNAREKANMKTKIIWVFTDYLEHFFPRISHRVDMTFVPHASQINYWTEYGVPPEKVQLALVPLPVSKIVAADLPPRKPGALLVTMMGGKEGLKDNVKILQSIIRDNPGELEFNVFTGRPPEAYKAVEDFAKTAPSRVKINLYGFVPREKVIAGIKMADVFITKGGGLSPAEGALLNKPMIIVDEYKGHERAHSEFFSKNGMSLNTTDASQVGALVAKLSADKVGIEQMTRRQQDFASAAGLDRISEAALTSDLTGPKDGVEIAPLGTFGGREVKRQFETLNQLNNDYPSNFEIILGYPLSKNGRYLDLGGDSNPFGHIAIRIKDKVYTVNYRSKIGEGRLHEQSSLAEYLYSTQARPEIFENYGFMGVNGQAYGRESIGIRYNGVPENVLQKMQTEFDAIEKEFQAKKIGYDVKTCNCATLARRVLESAGILPQQTTEEGLKGIAFPIDVYEEAVKSLESSPYKASAVRYAFVDGSLSGSVTTNVPLTIKKPVRAAMRVAMNAVFPKRIKLLAKPDAQIAFSPQGMGELYYENLTKRNLPNKCLWFYQK
tara:strand:+ start:28202 stop:30271 length:2070 start_codon:yes stop_codon:yes gene_type:complete